MGLEFSTTLKQVDVVIDGASYKLKELNGTLKGKYLQSMGSRVVINEQGKVAGMKSYEGLESALLCLCLFDSEDKAVPKVVIEKWPSTMLTSLFEAAQELSGLNQEGQEKLEAEAKNS
jgi:hypothetical protein